MKVLFIAFYILIGVLTRTVLHVGPNIEFVTAISLVMGYFFSKQKFAFAAPLIIMGISDLIIGNTIIFLFTWSAFAIAPLLGMSINKLNLLQESNKSIKSLIFNSEFAGIGFTLLFFLWTNFGVVVTSNMYSKDLNGLIQSYINGLPFLGNQLLANMIIVPAMFVITQYALNIKKKLNIH